MVKLLNYNEIVNLITVVGFPIVMCGAMAYFVKYITDRHREERKELNQQHTDEMKQVTEALNNNTLALQHLTYTLDK